MLRLADYFMRNPRITNMIIAVILMTGLLTFFNLQREEFPPLGMNIMKVTTYYPGAAPKDVEINVTNKIEDKLLEVENIKRISSMSMENISVIHAHINSSARHPDKVKDNIKDAINRVTDLPADIMERPAIEELGLENMPLVELAIGGTAGEQEQRQIAKRLESRLKAIEGVSRVQLIGYRKREIKIDAHVTKLKNHYLSFNDVMHAIKSRNVRETGGTIESFVSEKKVVTMSEYASPLEVDNVIIRSNYAGYNVKLKDVATIQDDYEEPKILYRGNGEPAIGLLVIKQKSADSIQLSKKIKTEIQQFKKTLPLNSKIEEIYDFSITTENMLSIVSTNFFIGFILVLLVMFFFLDLRSAFWSAFGIPFSIFGAMILFVLFGINLNVITLITIILVLGIVVDDAIVVTEKIFTLKQAGLKPYDAALEGVRSMIKPVSAAVVTTMLTFSPMLFIPGVIGKFMSTIPIVVILILSFSLLEALLFIPTHIMHAKAPKKPPKRILWFDRIKEYYRIYLEKALHHKGKLLLIFVSGFILVASLMGMTCTFIMDPDTDQDFFNVVIETPQGSSMERTALLMPEVEQVVISQVPQNMLKGYTTQIGHHNNNLAGIAGGQYSNWAMITVYLIPAAKRKQTSEEMIERINNDLQKLKQEKGYLRLDASIMPGLPVGKPVELTIASNDDLLRRKIENETQDVLQSIEGVSGVESTQQDGKAEIQLMLNYDKLAKVGLTATDVAHTVRTAFDGTVVTSIRYKGEDIDFRVRVKNPKKYQAQGILDLPVANKSGQLIALRYVANLKEEQGPAVIEHYNGKRAVTLKADVDSQKNSLVKVTDILKKHVQQYSSAALDSQFLFGGQEEEMATTMNGFLIALVVAMVSIYFILVVVFNSYFQPLMIMSVIPFALMSVFITLFFHRMPLTATAVIGTLGLIGVVVNDTIVMISHLNQICTANGYQPGIIAKAAMERFRPVVLTTFTTFAGLLPTAYGFGGDLPQMRPMVLIMAWGLIFATMVTLFFIPLVYGYKKVKK